MIQGLAYLPITRLVTDIVSMYLSLDNYMYGSKRGLFHLFVGDSTFIVVRSMRTI